MFVLVQGMNGSTHSPAMDIVTSNVTYTYGASASPPSGNYAMSTSVLTDMDSADTAKFSVTVSSSTKVVDIFGDASKPRTVVSGFLAC